MEGTSRDTKLTVMGCKTPIHGRKDLLHKLARPSEMEGKSCVRGAKNCIAVLLGLFGSDDRNAHYSVVNIEVETSRLDEQ